MQTRKLFLLIVFFSLFVTNSFLFGQFFIRLNTGYNFSAEKTTIKYPYVNCEWLYTAVRDSFTDAGYISYTIKDTNIYIEKPFRLNLGNGAQFGISAGYFINKYIGLTLDFAYQSTGLSFSSADEQTCKKYSVLDVYDLSRKYARYVEYKFSGSSYNITPAIIAKYDIKKFSPYMKLGMNIGIYNVFMHKNDYVTHQGQTTRLKDSLTVEKYTGNATRGFCFAVGANYHLTEKVSVFAETNFLNSIFAPVKRIIVDTKSTTAEGFNEYIYPETYALLDITYPEGNTIAQSQYSLVRQKFSFSSIGVHIGVQYTL